MNWLDLWQAIKDIQLQLIVTSVFLFILALAGICFFWLPRRKPHKQESPTPIVPETAPHKAPMTTKQWIEKQGTKNNKKNEPIQAEDVQPDRSWLLDLLEGLSTELLGAVITTALLGIGVLIFTQYQAVQNRKAELILQMGSDERVWAIEAARQLRQLGWLEDGTLSNTNLSETNLSNANLEGADLRKAELVFANLQSANLESANLFEANLLAANLQSATLIGANLIGAKLVSAKLTNANLSAGYLFGIGRYPPGADLTNADLSYANLTGANLNLATLTGATLIGADLKDSNLSDTDLTNVTLPDGTTWTKDTDMTPFTDPNHPNYWNPCVESRHIPVYCSDNSSN